jgi:signal transduction histidine kinase
MSRRCGAWVTNLSPKRRRENRTQSLVASCGLLVAGLAGALAIAQIALRPPLDELLLLGFVLALTGAAATAVWVLLLDTPITARWGLRGRAFLGSVVGGLLGLLNVLIIAQLMFISTSHDLWVLAAALAFSVAVMTSFSLFIATAVGARVDQLRIAVRSLSGDSYADLPTWSGDEFDNLEREVEHVSKMLKVAEAGRLLVEEERRLLTASVSHDLRTPISNLQAIGEALSNGVLESDEDRRHYVRLLLRETGRLSRMIDDLFDLARLDSGSLKLERRRLQFVEVVADVIEGMRPQASQSGISLILNAAENLPEVVVDGSRMERVVSNLLRNAIEHSPRGGSVELSLEADKQWLNLSVIDEGPGMEPGTVERIWERFYRGDESRSRGLSRGDGAGLGLAIVEGLVKAHGGMVRVDTAKGHGSSFRILLPRI